MNPDRFGDQLEQFRRWLIGRYWHDTVVRVLFVVVLSQIAFLLFGLGLVVLLWLYKALNF
jgi:hypothetical protein